MDFKTTSILPPKVQHLDSILPTEPLLLMGAGPVPIPHAVAKANGVVINHLGETMDQVIASMKRMARYAFQTEHAKILGVSGPASAAMEMAITNLLWPGRKVLVIKDGTFSARLGEMAQSVGAEVRFLEMGDHIPVPLEKLEEAFAKEHYDVITIAQGETSCGLFNPTLPEIARFAKKQGALVIVDAVCTLTTMPLKMDEWELDVVMAGGQKGLSSIPGVSLIAFSSDAWDAVEKRTAPCPHWCLDALRAQAFWGEQQYHYTAPVPGILALHEALRLICEETLPKRFLRHFISSKALQAGLESMGMELYIPEPHRLNSVVAITLPPGAKSHRIRKNMVAWFNVEISGAFGLEILRIGQMGEQCRSHNLFKVLYALGVSCRQEGVPLNVSSGMAKLEKSLTPNPEYFIT